MSKVIEVQNRRDSLEKSLTELKARILVLMIDTPEYDAAVQAYLSAKVSLARIPQEMIIAKQEDNAEAISKAKKEFLSAIDSLRMSTGIERLIGENLSTLVFMAGKPESEPGKGDTVASTVVFNPKRVGNRSRTLGGSLSEAKEKVMTFADLKRVLGMKMSPKREGEEARTGWVKSMVPKGIVLNGHGKRYYSDAGHAVAIAFANELQSSRLSDRWFLGIEDEPLDIVVLLCKDIKGNLHDFVLPFDKLASLWESLSRSRGQVKLNIRRTGIDFLLLNPGGEPLNITKYEGNYRSLKRTR